MEFKTVENLSEYLIRSHFDKNHKKILEELSKGIKRGKDLATKLGISQPGLSYYLLGQKRTARDIDDAPGMIHLGLIKRAHDDYGSLLGFEITKLGREILKVLK